MSLQALQDYTFFSKNSRYDAKAKRRETWGEAVQRVKEMHLRRYPQVAEDIEWAFQQVLEKRVLGSQRALQYGGKPIEEKSARIFNCAGTYCDRVRFFQESLWLLLCGCGVGFSAQKHHVAKLPPIFHNRYQKDCVWVVEDTIEGWADALGALVASYLSHPDLLHLIGLTILFDYSKIRPEGSLLSSGVGKAPGHKPLERALEKIRALLDRCIAAGQDRLRPIDAYDLLMHASDAVLSGGVRRSACICVFSPDDDEMIRAKTGNWFIENPQRGRSNNSACLVRSKTTQKQFFKYIDSIKQFGEPAFYFTDDTEQITNPCVTSDTVVATPQGLKQVHSLISQPFEALVDGKSHPSTSRGFWETSTQEVWQLTFASGRQVKMTANHQVLTDDGWKESRYLTELDTVVVHKHRTHTPIVEEESAEFAKAYCLGYFLANGTNIGEHSAHLEWWGERKEDYRRDGYELLKRAGWTNAHHLSESQSKSVSTGISSAKLLDYATSKGCWKNHKKCLSVEALDGGNWSYLAGLIAGYFDGDGTVSVNPQKGSSLRISSVEVENLRTLQIALNAFGIYSKIYSSRRKAGNYMLPDGKGGLASYPCKDAYELVVSRDSIDRFHKMIPLRHVDKSAKVKAIVETRQRTPYRDYFTDRLIGRESLGLQPVYDCTIPEVSAFDANGVYVHNCVEASFFPVDALTGETGFEFCVAGDTTLLTKNGRTAIAAAVGKETEIWNGQEWATVTPFVTGHNRKLYRVHLSDGSYLDCTDNHRWLVKNRFQKEYSEVQTKDLMSFSRYGIHTPQANVQCVSQTDEPLAYEYGFMLGDGTVAAGRKPWASLFGKKRQLQLAGARSGPFYNSLGTEYENLTFQGLDDDLAIELKYNDQLPQAIFAWDKPSVIAFMSGWLDADGSKANKGCRLYGSEGRIRDAQLLLTKVGIKSSVNLMAAEGAATNFGPRKQAMWYLQIADARKLNPKRFNTAFGSIHTGKGKNQLIERVEELPGLHTTYCLTEPKLHQCLFNNVLTLQCNLCEINGKKLKTQEDFRTAARAAAIIGTLQAGYTDFAYLGAATERITRREALLGISITGMMDSPRLVFDAEVQRSMAEYILTVNEEFAPKIGVNPTARATLVKPAGTTSCLLGTASGVHPHHAKRYFRRVQANQNEAALQYFEMWNPTAVKPSVWSANGTDKVITFCVDTEEEALTKNDLSAIDLLKHVQLTQNNWVKYGKNPARCTQPWLMHNVSNTINVREHEWDDVAEYIYENRDSFSGVSLLPASGDLDYAQAPMCNVLTPAEILAEYGDGSLMASGLIVDGLHAFGDLWAACEYALGLRGELVAPQETSKTWLQGLKDYALAIISRKESKRQMLAQVEFWKAEISHINRLSWIRRVKQFAERYCGGDVRKCTYLLKHVNNWKEWVDLKREYKEVDYTAFVELEDNTTIQETVACANGKCDL